MAERPREGAAQERPGTSSKPGHVAQEDDPLNILGFAGSLRKGSFNRGVLRAAIDLAPDGVTLSAVELDTIPLYNYDLETTVYPESVVAIKRQIAAAGALLIVTPEYQYSVPGVLKNVLDWISRPPGTSGLADKPVGIMGAAPGMAGTARAQMHLRQILLHERAAVMAYPQVLIADARRKFDADGTLTDQETRERIKTFMEALVRWAQKFSSQEGVPCLWKRTRMGTPATGKRVEFNTMDLWRVANGKLAEHWDVVDLMSMMQQLGVIPPMGQGR